MAAASVLWSVLASCCRCRSHSAFRSGRHPAPPSLGGCARWAPRCTVTSRASPTFPSPLLPPAPRSAFDAAYNGNRGPVEISIHTPFLQDPQFAADTRRFLQYALAQPDVWALTVSQMLDWMERPVPASGMPAFMAQYTCDK